MIRLKNVLLEQYYKEPIDPNLMPLPSDRTGKGGDFERQTRAMVGSEKPTPLIPVIKNVDEVISKIDKALKTAKRRWRNKINDPKTATRWQRSHGASELKWEEVKQTYLYLIHKSFVDPKRNWVVNKDYFSKLRKQYRHPNETKFYSLRMSIYPERRGVLGYVHSREPKRGIFLTFRITSIDAYGNITIEPQSGFGQELIDTFIHEIQHYLFEYHPLTSIKQIRKITRPKALLTKAIPVTNDIKQYAKRTIDMGWQEWSKAKKGLNRFEKGPLKLFFYRVIQDLRSYYKFAGRKLSSINDDWCIYMICMWIIKAEQSNCEYALTDTEMLSRIATVRKRHGGELEIPKSYLIKSFERKSYPGMGDYNWILIAWACNGFAPNLIDIYNETQNFVYNDAGSDDLGDKTQTMA